MSMRPTTMKRSTACLLALVPTLGACGVESRAVDAPTALPAPRAGGDVVGARVDASWIGRWIGEPLALSGEGAARATLLRWWTDTCPFCEASLPAIEELRERFAGRGLATVAVYHPKPPRFEDDEAVRAAAVERGYRGPLAVDGDWSALRRIWLDTGDRAATSASFLVDATGTIRYVHPGPELHPSDDPEHAACERDFRDLERAIEALLGD